MSARIYEIRGQYRDLIATFEDEKDAIKCIRAMQCALNVTLVLEGPKTGLRIPDFCTVSDGGIVCREINFML